jgi:Flp pilus assembly protein TadD/mono/diheme cytochrome c family protein
VRPRSVLGLAALLALSPACARPASPPTFGADVAPLVYTRCAPCHHERGAAPFPLTTYEQVRRRARQIVEVTGRRYMPPWPPVEGHGDFVGERRLSDDEIARLAAWVKAGTPKGDVAAPPTPTFPTSWQMGTPDLVLTAPSGFVLDAEGEDRFHNFVLPAGISGTRYVRAIEIVPGAPRLVHHANVLVDRSGWARARDAADPAVGFPGMDIEIVSDRFDPDSHFLFWKPGSPPLPEPDDMAWRLDRGADLVLNMHLRPSGKREEVRPSIGLYFTDRAPTRAPMLLQLEHDGAIDIPAGDAAFTVTDELTLPVDVQLLAIYPHAHYVGHEIQGTARLPDGTTRWLVHIADWDLNWQAVYRLKEPMRLPKGTVVSMKWIYDNSSRNERNPHDPPQRVRAGDRASDEMAHLWLQVLPRRADDRALLQEATMRARLRKYPGDFVALANLGSVLESAGRRDEAIDLLRAAVGARPRHAQARNMLGTALQAHGRLDEAAAEFVVATRLQPGYLDPEYNLGNVLLAKGQPAQAVPRFERVLRASPDDAAALSDLGSAWAMLGRFDRATQCLERSLRLQPKNAPAAFNLGLIAARRANLAEARRRFEQAVAIDPSNPDYQSALAEVAASPQR